MSAAIVAFGAVSAMGEGREAASAGSVGEPARCFITEDEVLAKAGFARPHVARVQREPSAEDPATTLLVRALRGCLRELDRVEPAWAERRVGLALGTSSGALHEAVRIFASCRDPVVPLDREQVGASFYFSPMASAVQALGRPFQPATLVMGACAASTLAIGLGMRWLEAEACDLVLAGGFDAVSVFVAAGFEVLRATTATLPPRPFRLGRDGMALGEGAAVLALRRGRVAGAHAYVTGFGASSDAVHLTAPDRTGSGLARAAHAALTEAGLTAVDLVSPHGSATPFSDAAEASAIRTALPGCASDVVVHPLKAQLGHTLGASGALEVLACVDALTRGVLPAAAGKGELDPDARVTLLDVARAGSPETALKLSAAFGGLNAALVVSRVEPPDARPRPPRRVYLGAPALLTSLPPSAELAERIAWPVDKVARADDLTRWVLAALADLALRDGSLSGAGILVGQSFATIETNAAFFARLDERGPRRAEPRRFPYTSPNAAAGDAGVAFGLTGPSFAVGSGLHAAVEALAVAVDLVRAGDAERLVVVAVDDCGPTVLRMAEALGVEVEAGAVALVVTAAPEGAIAEVVRTSSGAGSKEPTGPVAVGHRALLPLLATPLPSVLEASSPDLVSIRGGAARSTGWARLELAPANAFI